MKKTTLEEIPVAKESRQVVKLPKLVPREESFHSSDETEFEEEEMEAQESEEESEASVYMQEQEEKEREKSKDHNRGKDSKRRPSRQSVVKKRARTTIVLDEATTKRVVSQVLNALEKKESADLAFDRRYSTMPEEPNKAVDPFLESTLKELTDVKHRRRTELSYGDREKIRRNSIIQNATLIRESGVDAETAKKIGVEQAVYEAHRRKHEEVASEGKKRKSGMRGSMSIMKRASNLMPRLSLFKSGAEQSVSVTPLSALHQQGSESSLADDIQSLNKLQENKTIEKHKRYMETTVTETLEKHLKDEEEKYRKKFPDLWSSFVRYDKDGSGEIDSEELAMYLQLELGSTISDEDIKAFFSEIDDDMNGKVSFLELAEWYDGIVGSLDIGKNYIQKATVGSIFDFARFQGLKGVRNKFGHLAAAKTEANLLVAYDELDFLEMQNRRIIHPHSSFHLTWDFWASMILIVTVITLPLSIAFEEINEAMFAFNLAVDIVFLLDVVKNFWTGYVDNDGCIRLSQRRIVIHYITSWFIPDLVSSIPIDLVITVLDSEGTADPLARSAKTLKLVRLIRITKLFRLLRVGRAAKYISKWRRFLEDKLNWRIHESAIRMTKLAILLVVLAHWIGCIQFMICRLMDFPESSWVVYAGLVDMSPTQQYTWSFYKALAQMIGVGFETPPVTNLSCENLADDWCTFEMWVTLFSMYAGSIFYAIMISSISSIIFSMNFASRLYQEKTQQLNEYMRSKNLPPILRDKVRDYFALRYSEGKIFDEEAIMHDLSPALRREIMIFTSRELFLKVPFFRDSGNGFISSLATSMVPMVAFQNDLIIEEGTTGDSMFFISKGKVQIFVEEYSPDGDQSVQEPLPSPQKKNFKLSIFSQSRGASGLLGNKGQVSSTVSAGGSSQSKTVVIANIEEGCFFGEVALLLPVRRTASARSMTISILYVLGREELLAALKDFPEIYKRLKEIATSRVKRVTRRLKEGTNAKKKNRHRGFPLIDRDLQDMQAAALVKQAQMDNLPK